MTQREVEAELAKLKNQVAMLMAIVKPAKSAPKKSRQFHSGMQGKIATAWLRTYPNRVQSDT